MPGLNKLNELMEGNNKNHRLYEGVMTRTTWPEMRPFYLVGSSVVRDRKQQFHFAGQNQSVVLIFMVGGGTFKLLHIRLKANLPSQTNSRSNQESLEEGTLVKALTAFASEHLDNNHWH